MQYLKALLKRNFWANERPTSTEYDSDTARSLYPETETFPKTRATTWTTRSTRTNSSVRRSLPGTTRQRRTDEFENSSQNLEVTNIHLNSENRRLKLENEALHKKTVGWNLNFLIAFLLIVIFCCVCHNNVLKERHNALKNCKIASIRWNFYHNMIQVSKSIV